jgi:MinD superfamily P-loop ATPase
MLRQITVLSGKGGTGKTTLVASLAVLARNVVVTDCDVDAPDLHILLKPEIIEEQEFGSSKEAVIDETKCTECGKCEENCRFNAINGITVDPFLCEGCGVCAYICPVEAVELKEKLNGHAYISKIKYGFMSHALLNPGEENSGKLVSLVRQNATKITEKEKIDLILNDGPPGIGCPVIASIGGTDLGLVVVEPTLSGIHDMKRALGLLNHFNVKPLICVNKFDINVENTQMIENYCMENDLKLIGKIPFDTAIREALVLGQSPIEHSPKSKASREIYFVWDRIGLVLNQKKEKEKDL